MLIIPNAHVIDFNPEVRLPLMEAEALNQQRQTSEQVYTSIDHRDHDHYTQKAERTRRQRNLKVAGFAGYYVTVVGEYTLDMAILTRYPAATIAVGMTAGWFFGGVGEDNQQIKDQEDKAVRCAAYEVENAEYDKRDPSEWAVECLESAGVTAHEVLHPIIAAAQKEQPIQS